MNCVILYLKRGHNNFSLQSANCTITPAMKTLDYERYLFQLIVQERGESFDSFLERLKCQLPKCKFSNEESRLRGQIINKCALNNLRDQAFGNYMALNQLILQAQTIEQAEKGYRTQPERENRREDSKSCSRCGFMDHEYFSPSCPAKNSRCESCKKFGHYARLCRTPNYARKRAGDRRDDLDDSANIKNKRLRDETSARDPRAARATAGQAGPSNPSTSSGGTNKVETPKHVTADNGNIYIDTNDSNAGTKSTSSTRNGMTSTQTSA